MVDLPFPLDGTTLIVGPSNVGKTSLTAQSLSTWVEEHGTDGVVTFDFAPEIERDGRVLGGKLTQFMRIPDGVWYGEIDAVAPRAAGSTDAEAIELAETNATRSKQVFESAPKNPDAIFVNDATIPFQAETLDQSVLLEYCGNATTTVFNAFESDELGVDDAVSQNEQTALQMLYQQANRIVDLG